MEVSKLTISGDTLKAYSQELSKKRKTKLRREAIIAYINSKPAGSIIKVQTLQNVAGFKYSSEISMFLNRMVKDKLIGKQFAEGSKRYFTWWTIENAPKAKVLADAHKEAVADVLPEAVKVTTEAPEVQQQALNVVVDADIVSLAKDFAWRNNTDSLRQFINFFESVKRFK